MLRRARGGLLPSAACVTGLHFGSELRADACLVRGECGTEQRQPLRCPLAWDHGGPAATLVAAEKKADIRRSGAGKLGRPEAVAKAPELKLGAHSERPAVTPKARDRVDGGELR